jgi:HD-GYP domain-containing protein (c-di-GMP phosphodiesterase class II)
MHPQAGYDVLKDIEFPWPIAQVILQHHERMDGGGYPNGLKGPDILLEARIMAVADVVESMSSHRPYRPGLGIEAALAEIEQHSGSRYDANVVAACQRLFRQKHYDFES